MYCVITNITQMATNVAIPALEANCSGIISAIVPICESKVNVTTTIVIVIKSFLLSKLQMDSTNGPVRDTLLCTLC